MSNNKLLLVLVNHLIDKCQDKQTTSTPIIQKKSSKKEQQVQDSDISSMFSDSFDDFVKGENKQFSSQTPSQNIQKPATHQEIKVTDAVNKPSTKISQKQNTHQNTSKDTTVSTEDFPDSFGDFDFD
jgi:hypothetical protein